MAKTDNIQLTDSFHLAAEVSNRLTTIAVEHLGISMPADNIEEILRVINFDRQAIANKVAEVCHENAEAFANFLPMITGSGEEFNATVILWSSLQATMLQYNALMRMKSILGADVNTYSPAQTLVLSRWLNGATVPGIQMGYGKVGEA
jgi:hypothetical protein